MADEKQQQADRAAIQLVALAADGRQPAAARVVAGAIGGLYLALRAIASPTIAAATRTPPAKDMGWLQRTDEGA